MRAAGVVLCVVLCGFAPSRARAGAWLHPAGRGQVIVATTFAESRNAFDARGRLVATPAYRKFETRAYVEHGLTDWLNFVGEAAFMKFDGAPPPLAHLDRLVAEAKAGLPLSLRGPPGPHYEGLGAGAVGARLRLFAYGEYVFSVESGLRAASAEARRFLDMRGGVQIDARLLVGRPLNVLGASGFFDAQFGYRSRGQNGDELRVDLTAGLRPLARLTLMAQSFSALARRMGGGAGFAAQKFQLSAVYDVTPALSLQLGGVTALGGVNSPAERGVVTGLWWRY